MVAGELGIERAPGNPGPTDNPLNIVRFKKSQLDYLDILLNDIDSIVIGRMHFDGTRLKSEWDLHPSTIEAYLNFKYALNADIYSVEKPVEVPVLPPETFVSEKPFVEPVKKPLEEPKSDFGFQSTLKKNK